MPASSVFAAGSTALVTGGASGIGFALAKLCRAKGMNVVIADLNIEALESSKAILAELPAAAEARVLAAAVDVSSIDAWKNLKDTVVAEFGTIEFLALNAGVGGKGTWGDDDYFRKILETNLFGVINGVGAFLPVVQEAAKSKPTSIVITGSKQGITNPPGNAAYNASKSAVKTLAEHLSWDLKGTSTSVHLLVPGWTFTGMTSGNRTEKPAGAWAPEQVVDFLYQKMDKDEFYAICPDNDVSEETDKKRMLWTMGDVVYGRPPLTRWRDEWKKEAEETMAKTQV